MNKMSYISLQEADLTFCLRTPSGTVCKDRCAGPYWAVCSGKLISGASKRSCAPFDGRFAEFESCSCLYERNPSSCKSFRRVLEVPVRRPLYIMSAVYSSASLIPVGLLAGQRHCADIYLAPCICSRNDAVKLEAATVIQKHCSALYSFVMDFDMDLSQFVQRYVMFASNSFGRARRCRVRSP